MELSKGCLASNKVKGTLIFLFNFQLTNEFHLNFLIPFSSTQKSKYKGWNKDKHFSQLCILLYIYANVVN